MNILSGIHWEMQPWETVTQYQAYCLYRDLPGVRSRKKVQQHLGHKDPSTVNEWCRKNRWIDRSKDYDIYKSNLVKEHSEKIGNEVNEMQFDISTKGLKKIDKWLDNLDPLTLKPTAAAILFRELTRMQRISAGLDSDSKALNITNDKIDTLAEKARKRKDAQRKMEDNK